ncbi:UNVERIFIED_ORG: hypothetical protein [Escherichia phage CMSTMSU]
MEWLKVKTENQSIDNQTLTLLDYNSSDYVNTTSLEYSMYTLDRAIPGLMALRVHNVKQSSPSQKLVVKSKLYHVLVK